MARLNSSPIVESDIAQVLACELPWERFRGSSVLVTGAAGMLPSYAVLVLLALNDARDMDLRIIGLVRNEAKARSILGPVLDRPDFKLLVQDVTDALTLPDP